MLKVKNIIDISRRIKPQMILWPGDRAVRVEKLASIDEGEECNLSSIEMGIHTGTHIDAPFHFIQEGITVQSLDLSRFLGQVKVFEPETEKCITKESIEGFEIEDGDIVFFKTRNSYVPEDRGFDKEYVYIDASAARYLVDKKIKAAGIDGLSIDSFYSADYPAHHIFLSREIGVIENLQLKDVIPGEYFLVCLPLNIEGAEGSPVRAALVEFE